MLNKLFNDSYENLTKFEWLELKEKYLVYVLSFISFIYFIVMIVISINNNFFDMHNTYVNVVGYMINIISMCMIFILMIYLINDLFSADTKKVKQLLYFLSILMIFTRVQEVNLTWRLHDYVYFLYFSPLLSAYLLVKLSFEYSHKLLIIVLMSITVSTLVIYSNISTDIFFRFFLSLEFMKYFLIHLGGIYYYISGKEYITISLIAGIFVLGTFFYLASLSILNKIQNRYYFVIIAFLFYYIVMVFVQVSQSINLDNHYIYRHKYLTLSLIAWNLIFIFYVHKFRNNISISHKIFFLGLTLSFFLLFIQFISYPKNLRMFLYKQTAITALNLNIDDTDYRSSVLHNLSISTNMNFIALRKQTEKIIEENLSPIEYKKIQDIKSMMGNSIVKIPKVKLHGDLDKVVEIASKSNTFRIHGWIYDPVEEQIPSILYVLNEQRIIIGYVITGEYRRDISKTYGMKSFKSGYIGYMITQENTEKIYIIDIEKDKVVEIKLNRYNNILK